MKILLLVALIIASCTPSIGKVAPTVTLSLAGQTFNQDGQRAQTELEVIEATAAAEFEARQIDINAQQANINIQNAIAENMIKVYADQTLVAVGVTRVAIVRELATLTIQNAQAQAEGEIIISDARLEIESDQNSVSFGHWLMILAVFGAAAIATGLWHRLYRIKIIEDQENDERGLVVDKQRADTNIAISRALIAKYEAQAAQAKAWQQAMQILSDGTAFLLVPNADGLPEKHWVNTEPTIIDVTPEAAITNTASKRHDEINRPIHVDDIDLKNEGKIKRQLIDFIAAIIKRYDEYVEQNREDTEGVAQAKLLRHSHLTQYNPDTWMLLTDILQHNKLIIKRDRQSTRVNPDADLTNLGDLLKFLTSGRVLEATPPPSEIAPKNGQQSKTTAKTDITVVEQPNEAGGLHWASTSLPVPGDQ